MNNKFKQAFTNLGAGTSQFVISPYQGVSDIIGYFKLPTGSYANGVVPQGWAYNLIRQVSVRYGSSAQYFFTGQQLYLQNLWDCENSQKAYTLSVLGGEALVEADISGAEAYFYLNLPHNSPRADGKPLPFPSDLLVQPIVITIELNPLSAIVLQQSGQGSAPTLPGSTNLQDAYIQVKAEMMADSADLLARREDMNVKAYTFPLKYFPQQEVQIACGVGSTSASSPVSVNLTGFRAGEVRNILLWLTSSTSVSEQGPAYWLPITDAVLTYNGEIFYRADSASKDIWNLVVDTKPQIVSLAAQDGSGGVTAAYPLTWTDIPFAQVNTPYDKELKMVHGKPILNAVVNLSFTTPAVLSSPASYTLHAVYIYNSSLMCTRGSAEYIF